MKIEKTITGYLDENCYVVSKDNDCLIVDPGDDVDKIKELVGNRKVLGILITHYHFDHVGALDEAVKKYNAPVIDYKNDKIQNINNFNFEIIPMPGHKEDLVIFYFKDENIMFTGDFLFKKSIGRCDLDGGNYNEMLKSIEKIKKYNRDITIYPGHGEASTLGYEFDNNVYLRGEYDE